MNMKMERLDESRAMLVKAFYYALGAYSEQESKKFDQWRDQNIGQLYDHLKHEMEEIKRSMTESSTMKLVHNCGDAVGLASILMAKVMELTKLS